MLPKRSKTYASADVADVDGIKQSFNTSTSVVALTVADWRTDAAITSTGLLDLPRTVTISRTSAANQYSVSPIVLTGWRGGVEVTESLTPTNDDGNDILRGTQAFDILTGIAIPAQAGTGGSFQIGVQDICAPANSKFCGCELASAGTLNVAYGGTDSAVVNTDAIPVAAAMVGQIKPGEFRRILTSSALSSPTSTGLTVYIP